jgi:hypothetical protein
MTFALAMFSNAWDSPFIVPVAGCVMILGIVVAGIVSGIRTREMESQERLAAIAKGLPVPPTKEEMELNRVLPMGSTKRRIANSRLAGLILVGTGLGLAVMCSIIAMILGVREVYCGAAAGLIPLGIGVGLLIDSNIQKRELEAADAGQPPTR